jgi:hypothetical protein
MAAAKSQMAEMARMRKAKMAMIEMELKYGVEAVVQMPEYRKLQLKYTAAWAALQAGREVGAE